MAPGAADRRATGSGPPGHAEGHGQDRGRETLDAAVDDLEQEVPDRVSRAIHWLRAPEARWVRLPLGLLLIAASFLWFLPVLGIEMLPLGLVLVAYDVPFLRKPVGTMLLWLEDRWRRFKARRHRRQDD